MRLACPTFVAALSVLVTQGFALSDDTPGNSAYLPAQAAADVLREYAGVDGAFLGADEVKTTYSKQNLSSLLAFPAVDKLVIVSLTGAELKRAFERSVSLYPQDNPDFLQISGFEVTFNKTADPESRVVKATVGGSPIDDHKTYTVAMPDELGNGALGYFKIWDKGQITKTYDKTVDSILLGKPYAATSPRWSSQ
jgi:2',3'-cyclic-nucleotide 2'-phosphodiesterase (5'-nucleotidase family)